MVPPMVPNTHEVNKSAPLSQWTKRHAFPKNEECEAARERLQKAGLARQANQDAVGRHRGHNPDLHCARCQAQCVADDDPRLKSN